MYPYLYDELRISSDKDKSILEIGVGSASDACSSLNKSAPARYVLFDLSSNTLTLAKKHLDEHCAGKPYEFVNGDASNMDLFHDDEFARVKSIGVIHHIPTYQNVLEEISRVLKPGGDFIFMFYNRESRRYLHSYPRIVRRGESGGKSVDQMILEVDGQGNPYTKLFTKSEIAQMCDAVGLKCDRFRLKELYDDDRSIIIKDHYYKIYPRFFERWWGFAMYVYGHKSQHL
jgi:ubiquinone/menaquinone biosynthesis C-methylase UbiE